MTNSRASTPARPDYGVDAPGVVRNLLLAAAAGAILAVLVWRHLLPPAIVWHPRAGIDVGVSLLGFGVGPAIGCAAGAAAMLWSSRVGKVLRREELLDTMAWSGEELVLDVGCGRGLMLIGAAKRLRSGRATGIDLWRAEDLSGNRAEATLANAEAEGVADRVRVETGDMRELPFADRTFDRVLSSKAIHNLSLAADRVRAIREIARVLRPGGYVLIDDVRHRREYEDALIESGCPSVRRLDGRLGSLLWTILTFGSLRPGSLLAQKAS